MRYTCDNRGCTKFRDCPLGLKMEVVEHSDLTEAGEQQFYAVCHLTGYTVLDLSTDDVGAIAVKRTKSQRAKSATKISGRRFKTDAKCSAIVDIAHTRDNGYAIDEEDYVGIRSDETRAVIKKLLAAVGKGVDGKGWVPAGDARWSRLFQKGPAKKFKDDQIQVDYPFDDRKSYWRIIPDAAFDRLSPKGKSRTTTKLVFGKGS